MNERRIQTEEKHSCIILKAKKKDVNNAMPCQWNTKTVLLCMEGKEKKTL